MGRADILKPTVQQMDEIIQEVKELRSAVERVSNIPLEFPEHGEADNQRPAIEDLIRAAGGLEVQMKLNRKRKKATSKRPLSPEENREFVEAIDIAQRSERCVGAVLRRLPGFSERKLERLRGDFIPGLWTQMPMFDRTPRPLSISAVGQGNCGPGRSEEARRLDAIIWAINRQIEENSKAAADRRWTKHVEPIHKQFKKLCYPFETYLNTQARGKQEDETIEKMLLEKDGLSVLLHYQERLERIRYKVEVEASNRVPTSNRRPPNGPGQASEMTRREETGSAATTINIQNSTVIMADGNATINIDQHIEYITNLRDAVATQPETSPTFAKVAKKTALDIIESTLKDVAKGQVREAATQIYELGKDLGPVIFNTAAYGFFRNWLGL
jgi:hypothetical protein